MAAEKTPSRRKQCVLHRTFLKLPFGRCDRRSRSNTSSYDVHHIEASQATEKWSPSELSIAALGLHQPHHGGNMNLDGASGRSTTAGVTGAQSEVMAFQPVMGHQSGLAFPTENSMGHQDMDDIGRQEVDSAYSSVSHIEEESSHHMMSPPSPSVSSMETDMGVDPETGERALE